MKGRILLLMTPYYSINRLIIESLQKMGYEVVFFDGLCREFSYQNWRQKIYNFWQKTFRNNREYKLSLRKTHLENETKRVLDYPENYFDYTLVIRPDNYTLNVVEHLKIISKKLIAYQFDGVNRFKDMTEMINKYDVFSVFDEEDYQQLNSKFNNIHLGHNFYFDVISQPIQKNVDLLYIGAEQDNRISILSHIHSLSKEKNNLFLLHSKQKNKIEGILFSKEILPYEDIVKMSATAKIIIDIKYPKHNGLSFRFFEALYLSQKMITDNPYVKKFDFYHPNNILVMDDFMGLTKESLTTFLEKPYIEVSPEIKEKYSFENWFYHMINL